MYRPITTPETKADYVADEASLKNAEHRAPNTPCMQHPACRIINGCELLAIKLFRWIIPSSK
jgi:hypothetical protein